MSKVYAVVTDRIIKQLEQGVVPWRKTWAEGAGLGECKSLVSQKPYRGINAFITAAAGYASPYFLTYKQAQELGAQVRAGERGLPVVFFTKLERESVKKPGEKVEVPMLRYYTVFNVEQVEGLKLRDSLLYPKRAEREFKPIEACSRVVAGMPQAPRLIHQEQKAYYSPMLDYVNMPKPETFESPEAYYATLFHELTHSTGHSSRVDRKLESKLAAFGSADYSKEELVAEMGAAFLCAHTGIEASTIQNSASYIASWLKVLKGDPKLVVSAASQAQKAAEFITGGAS